MLSSKNYIKAVNDYLTDFIEEKITVARQISNEAAELCQHIYEVAKGGKRTRAQLNYLGYLVANGKNEDLSIKIGTAIELFQTSALIHDDIIDSSDTRRGIDTIHYSYSNNHQAQGYSGNNKDYGMAAGIIAGDICMQWSEEIFSQAIVKSPQNIAARKNFETMRLEVMAGQFMDIHEEVDFNTNHELTPHERAFRVLTYKSAKYSVEHPLTIGATLGGADTELLSKLSAFGLPTGQAFQLRDDVLGVFGDPTITGKPAGDDLKEGKRTTLIAYAIENSDVDTTNYLNAKLGSTELTKAEVAMLQEIIKASGALAKTEEMITNLTDTAIKELAALKINAELKAELEKLAHTLTQRNA
ncbi:MAG: polyprenyl synthetase family protein [Micrococcaceae bacterium]